MNLTRTRRAAAALVAVAAISVAVAGCGGSSEKKGGEDPQAVMTEAKKQFDDASSVHLAMATDSLPTEGNAVLGANGTLTDQPAFKGDVKVLFSGFNTTIPVVAVDGKVYAKIPLTPKFAAIDPSAYGAPDPAGFADPDTGISGLLLKIEDLKETGQKRVGKQVITTYSGTLPGDLVAPIIPSADASGTYQVVVGIDEDGRVATLKVTGDFFSGSGDVTYDLVFTDYDEAVTVTAP